MRGGALSVIGIDQVSRQRLRLAGLGALKLLVLVLAPLLAVAVMRRLTEPAGAAPDDHAASADDAALTGARPAPTAPDAAGVGHLSLWFGALAGPLAWSLHLLVAYALVSIACQGGFAGSTVLGLGLSDLLVLIVTVVAGLVTLGAGGVAYRNWRRLGGQRLLGLEGDRGRPAFMARAGVLASGLFLLAILAAGLPPFLLPPCR